MARRKKKAKRQIQSYRKPPMPAWFNTTPAGICRWCNTPIFNDKGEINLRRRWHKDCLHPYFLLTRQSYAKREIKKRDKGVCCDCGKKCRYRSEWDLDHEKPLIDAHGDISYWQLGNLRTRCKKCHLDKTLKENEDRRLRKNANKKG
jgi:5-methylcytosine-specific restriction endonuclease McrA